MRGAMDTPIAFIVFNRPDTTRRVFAEIAKAKPSRLLVIADGPRNEAEAERCAEVREIASRIDWPCDVQANFSSVNLGCRVRIQTGLDWVFEQTEEAIILEDDTLPHPSFFPFCAELLARYRNDARVASIGGCATIRGPRRYSYRFSHLPFIWGWATWRRVWQSADKDFPGWPDWDALKHNPDPRFKQYWDREFQAVIEGRLDSWDYQFLYSHLRHGWLSAISNTNLITNLGVGNGATNTKRNDYNMPLPVQPVRFPLRHPSVERDITSDNIYWRRRLRPQVYEFQTIWERAIGKARLALGL